MVLYAIQQRTASSPVCIEILRWIYVKTAIGQSKISALSGHFVVDIGFISTIDTFIEAAKTFGRGKVMYLFVLGKKESLRNLPIVFRLFTLPFQEQSAY